MRVFCTPPLVKRYSIVFFGKQLDVGLRVVRQIDKIIMKNMLSTQRVKALVEPILLYASDFWGILKLPEDNAIENVHISFCKQLLGVQKQTTNIGVLLELGQIPLRIFALKNAIKNILHNLKWPNRIENVITEIGLRVIFLQKDKTSHFYVFQRLRDIYHQESTRSAISKKKVN